MKNKLWQHIINVILFLTLIVGGLSNIYLFEIIGFVFSLCIFFIVVHLEEKISFPPGTYFFIFFISFQILSLTWSKNTYNSIEYIMLFLTAFVFQLSFYNLKIYEANDFKKNLIIVGIIFGLIFVFTQLIPISIVKNIFSSNCCNLYSPYSPNHNLIGDYWAIIMIIAIIDLLNRNSLINILFVSLAFTLITISQSRSAFISIFIPAYLLSKNMNQKIKEIYYLKTVIYLTIIVFIILGLGKVTILARPYYIQGIISLFSKPFGVGMGNFKQLTENQTTNIFLLTNFSAAKAHNIFLEVFSGIGIFGLSFILWLIYSLKDIIANSTKVNFLFLTIFIGISINFFFNVTYTIPTMLWIWFICIGMIQKKNNI